MAFCSYQWGGGPVLGHEGPQVPFDFGSETSGSLRQILTWVTPILSRVLRPVGSGSEVP